MSAKKKQPGKNVATDSPTAWFCTLEIARNKDDLALAQHARAELKRLGVEVRFKGENRKGVNRER